MAEYLLGKITLAKDYDPTSTINDAVPSDLANASITNATVNTQLLNQLNVTATATPFTVDLPMGVTIDFSYGTQFTVAVDINVTTAGESRRSVQVQLLNASNTIITQSAITSLSSGANSVSVDLDSGGLEWTKVRLKCFYKGGTGPTFEYSNVNITNSAASVFNTGDVIIVYWDDVADDFIVQRQDNPTGTITTITAGPNLGPLEFEQFFDGGYYKYCDGTTLVLFTFTFDSPDYPYFGKELLYANALCLTGNLSCNVRFVAATITGATNKYSTDGQVQFSAYASDYNQPGDLNPIKYTEFNPDTDIRGQYANAKNSSGLFTNLKAGLHTFYAVDAYGCYNSISVIIPSEAESSYNPKFRVRYYDVHTDVQSTIDIQERGYGGDVIYVDGGSSVPFTLSKETGELNNKLDVIRPTFAELTLNSGEHFQYISLYTQDDKKYKLSFTHGSTSWIGYLVSSAYKEEYSPSKNYPVSISATDGLASLVDYDFVDSSGNVFSGLLSIRQIILECVNKIGFKINLVIGVNKYATGMSSATTDDPLGQVYIDAETFLEDGTPMKCDEVLERVLKPFGAFIIQKNSKWHVIEFEAQTSSYYYREYDYTNTFVTSGTINPIINIDRPYVNLENVLFSGSPSLEVIPAYGKISVVSSLEGRESIFPLSLDEWSPNIANGGTTLAIDDPENPAYKALQITYLGSGYLRLLSPSFDVKAIADAVEMSLKVRYEWQKFAPIDINGLFIGTNSLNDFEPVTMPIGWSFRQTVNDVDYYFNEGLGWSKEATWGTSTTSVAIPTTHPTSKTFTTQTGLSIVAGGVIKVQYNATNYFRAVITSYNATTGSLTCESFAEIGSGTYTSWTIYNAGSEYNLNRLYVDKYREFVDFSKKIPLLIQSAITTPTSTLQLILYFYGEQYKDYTSNATLKALPSATLPAGYNAYPSFTLTKGTDADNGTTILRPDDYDGTTNTVVWIQNDNTQTSILGSIELKDVRVKYLPNKQNLVEKHTVSFINNTTYREILDYELDICDIPTELAPGHEAYKNILRYSDGDPTYGWARRGFNESHLIQELLIKTLGNQYASPVWRLSGDWLGPDITVTSIIKHTVKQLTYSITNPDLPGGSGWEQVGAGTTWTNGGTYYQAAFTGSGDSLIIRQNASLVAGARIKIDFNLIRLSSSGTRVDRLVLVLYSGATIIQTETLLDKIEADTDSTWTSWVSIENNCDKIGFYIDNMAGTGSATYRINSFNATGVPSVRYYYLNRMERQDRMNLYRAELAQIVPVERASTQDDVNGSGGFAGDSWSSGFSTGFGAGFSSGSYWG
jgi:hypothetical protein